MSFRDTYSRSMWDCCLVTCSLLKIERKLDVTATKKRSVDNVILSYRVDRTLKNLTLLFPWAICVVGECMCDGWSCQTFLGVQVPADAGTAGIACLLSLHMFPLFAPEPGGPLAAAGCSTHPEKYQNNVSL